MTFAEPFDAVVGRFVLLFCPEPVAVLRQVVGHVRVGGVIVFQEPDWAGCRSAPESLLWTRCVDWCDEAFRRSGADPYLGAHARLVPGLGRFLVGRFFYSDAVNTVIVVMSVVTVKVLGLSGSTCQSERTGGTTVVPGSP